MHVKGSLVGSDVRTRVVTMLLCTAPCMLSVSCKGTGSESPPRGSAQPVQERDPAPTVAESTRRSLRSLATKHLACPSTLVVSGGDGNIRSSYGCARPGAAAGEFVGEYGQWYPTGVRAVIGYFDDDGKRTGRWRWFDEQGRTTATKLYAGGSEVPVPAETFFLYVKIPEAIMPIARGEKYEDPLQRFLERNGLGDVTGGGSALAADGQIEYVGIDVNVYDPDKAIPLIAAALRDLGVPRGTSIQQTAPHEREVPVW